jgi:hypothetical protein
METTLAGNAIRRRLEANFRKRLSVIRPHEVGRRQHDAVALNVEGEPQCRHLKHLLMQTRVELRNRGGRWMGLHRAILSCFVGAAELGVALEKAKSGYGRKLLSGCSILHTGRLANEERPNAT